MKIFTYWPNAENFNSLVTDSKFRELKYSIGEGNPMANDWNELPVHNYFGDNKGEFPQTAGDFPSLAGGVPVVSEKAWAILEPYIGQSVEALPLNHPYGKYFALNVMDIVEALDKEKSEISYNKVTNRVSRVFKYVFDAEKIRGKYMFKVPETKGLEVYVSDEFKKIVEENNLKGLDFSREIFSA